MTNKTSVNDCSKINFQQFNYKDSNKWYIRLKYLSHSINSLIRKYVRESLILRRPPTFICGLNRSDVISGLVSAVIAWASATTGSSLPACN